MHIVVDRPSRLGKVQRTASGGARIPATLARVGVMDYYYEGKLIRQYNPPEVLAEATASANDVPVTFRHPKEREVTPENYQREARGHISAAPPVRFDGTSLVGELVVQDMTLLDAIERGDVSEISMGYSIEIDETPGITPDGERYDWKRTKVVFNHVAVLEAGRAGKTVKLLLDSEKDSILTEEDTMKIMIDGVEVSPEAVQGKIEGLCATRDALKQTNDSLTAKLAEATDPVKLEAKVEAAAQAKFEKRIADEKAASEKAASDKLFAENLAKAKTAYPKLVLDEKTSPLYLDGLLAVLTTDAADLAAMRGGDRGTEAPKPGDEKPETANDENEELSPREYQRRANAEAWRLPIPGAASAK